MFYITLASFNKSHGQLNMTADLENYQEEKISKRKCFSTKGKTLLENLQLNSYFNNIFKKPITIWSVELN